MKYLIKNSYPILCVFILLFSSCTKEDDTSDSVNENNHIQDFYMIYQGVPTAKDTLADLSSYAAYSSAIRFELLSQQPSNSIYISEEGLIIATADAANNIGEDTILQGEVAVSSPTEERTINFHILLSSQALFVSHWKLEDSYELQLPLYEGTKDDPTEYDFQVDWGDGTVDHITSPTDKKAKHYYATTGEKKLSIIGKLKGFNFYANNHSKNFITDISAWGDVLIGNKGGYFYQCSNLATFSASDAPDLSQTTDLTACFFGARNFNGDIGHWDVSTITHMREMFLNNSSFNQSLAHWDVSNVRTMRKMFRWATHFNQDISSWDVSKVKDMSYMFQHAFAFNQNLASWDVSEVEDMEWMFNNAIAFNGDISTWDVSKVLDMEQMFLKAYAFNGDISSWNVGSVTNMERMFYDADAFNANLSAWDVSYVTDMERMFYSANAFNGNISAWDVSNVTDMERMFYSAVIFNQDLSAWNTEKVVSCDEFSLYSGMSSEHLPTKGSCFGNE